MSNNERQALTEALEKIEEFAGSEHPALLGIIATDALKLAKTLREMKFEVSVKQEENGFSWRVSGTHDADTWPDVLTEVDRQAREIDEDAWQAVCDADHGPDELADIEGWRHCRGKDL